jgi:CheY-like chemotaxis protein
VWNLLSNAVKFTPAGGAVDVQIARRGSEVELIVRDTGMGIEAAFLPFVFERFRQADGSAARQHGGLGLGLSIVRSLVEMHGGTVVADSAGAGSGAIFTVSLPAALARAPKTEGPHQSDLSKALEGARMLVVDDEEDARDLTAAILRRSGASVTVASSAADALAEIECAARPFDLLISDLGMPGTDGFVLLQMVRERCADPARQLPAIALSAYARPEDRSRAFDAGYSAHISKPFDPDALVHTCREALVDVDNRL